MATVIGNATYTHVVSSLIKYELLANLLPTIYVADNLDDQVQGKKYQILSPKLVIESKAINVSTNPNPIDAPLPNMIDTHKWIIYVDKHPITTNNNSINQAIFSWLPNSIANIKTAKLVENKKLNRSIKSFPP